MAGQRSTAGGTPQETSCEPRTPDPAVNLTARVLRDHFPPCPNASLLAPQLVGDFPPATEADWRALVAKTLGEAPFSSLEKVTVEGPADRDALPRPPPSPPSRPGRWTPTAIGRSAPSRRIPTPPARTARCCATWRATPPRSSCASTRSGRRASRSGPPATWLACSTASSWSSPPSPWTPASWVPRAADWLGARRQGLAQRPAALQPRSPERLRGIGRQPRPGRIAPDLRRHGRRAAGRHLSAGPALPGVRPRDP